MEVRVSDLYPNPFRNIEKYKIDRDKVQALKTSIEETTFWDNILARPKNGGFEIAYGHHRWAALKDLGIDEVNIPVRELDDSTMLRIMANENLADWATTPAVINETIFAAKKFLDGELAKCTDWNHAQDFLNMIFASNSQFENCKKNGVGQSTIKKFLGGNWSDYMIQEAP